MEKESNRGKLNFSYKKHFSFYYLNEFYEPSNQIDKFISVLKIFKLASKFG
jgi:hypothetical protein